MVFTACHGLKVTFCFPPFDGSAQFSKRFCYEKEEHMTVSFLLVSAIASIQGVLPLFLYYRKQ